MRKNKKEKTKINKISKLFIAVSLLAVFLITNIVQAATIYPSPSSGSYNVGQTFAVGVFVSSSDQAMNAVSGTLSFPKDKLEVTSVSKSGSVINLWVQDPSFSNSSGTVSFEGIVLNPGFTGSAGRVITVNFKTKAPGTADITFSSGSVLANDGQGTSILEGLGSGRFAIDVPVEGPAAEEATTQVPTTGTLPAPKINSETHPDSDSWYAQSVAKFSWDLPAGASATRLLVGSKPSADPTVGYSPAISSRELDALDDGIWYFHVRLRNSAGWGDISHFRFQIDTKDPEFFDVTLLATDDPTNPTRKFVFESEDSMSGIGHYEIQIDDGNPLQWEDDGEHTYETPVLGPGKHTLIFKAVDKAGNYLTNTSQFVIDPLIAPTIKEYPEEITNQDPFVVRGETYPNSQVVMWLQREATDPVNYIIKSDTSGKFTFIADDKLRDGVYNMWAEVVDERGARSEPTKKYSVVVQKPKLLQIGDTTVSILSVVIPLIALIFFLAFMVWFMWYKLRSLRSSIKVEVGEAHRALHNEVKFLKKEIKGHSKLMEKYLAKKRLTRAEKLEMDQFQKNLENSIKKVDKEIEDVNKQLR